MRQCIIWVLVIEEDHPQQSSGKVLSNCTLNYGRHRQQTLHAYDYENSALILAGYAGFVCLYYLSTRHPDS